MQRVFNKTHTFLKIARSGFKPTFSISQMRWQQSRIISRWSIDFQSRSLMTQRLSPFSTTRKTGSEEETKKEENLTIPNQNETISDKKVAEDLLKYISSDPKEIYTNQELKKTPLYKVLFQEGVPLNELITSLPQERLLMGSFNISKITGPYCIFFPNTIFQQIFETCESLVDQKKILITAQQGLGKTYALALYVYLKRKQSNCRVFYIHNCQDFLDVPFTGFIQQIAVAFAEELKIQGLKDTFEGLKKIIYDGDAPIAKKMNEIYLFSAQLGFYLREKDLKAYMIVDQVNVLAKERNKMKAEIVTDILNTFNHALGGTRNIYVASKTDEDIMSQTQERPEIELVPPLEQEESLQAYIRFLAGNHMLEEKTIQSIINITGCVPLEVRMFFQFLGSKPLTQEIIENYKENKIDSLRIIFNHFLKRNEDHLNHMAFALEGLMNNGKYYSGMDRTRIDQRFLYVNRTEKKIYPLSPLVKEGLKECYLEEPKYIDKIVQQLEYHPTILGFLTEMEIQKLALVWLFSSKFRFLKVKESTGEVVPAFGDLEINSSASVENFGDKYDSNIFKILENNGYHTVHSKFPVFDGILVQDDKLVLVQIKRRSPRKVQEAAAFIQKEIESFLNLDKKSFVFDSITKDPRATGIVKRQEMIQFVLFRALEKNKSLDIIFTMSEGHLNNQYYKQITSEGKTFIIRFLQLSIKDALEKANMNEITKDILSKTQESRIRVERIDFV